MNDSIGAKIPGLAQPWKWVQPADDAQLLERLAHAFNYKVNERERENLCSIAFDRLAQLLRERQWLKNNVVYLEHKQNGVLPKDAKVGGWWPAEETDVSPRDPDLIGLNLDEYLREMAK